MKQKNVHRIFLLCISLWFLFPACESDKQIKTQILVAGGSASGTTAAIQAARSGAEVVLVEYTPWLGGMLTSAGVSATDGNHQMPSGLWGEFRDELYEHYGGPEAVETGWVSNTLFEPHIGNKILTKMVDAEKNITRFHGYRVVDVLVEDNKVVGAVFENDNKIKLTVRADITIDATELGDVLALSGANYFIGQDSRERTGEPGAPDKATDIIQDLTYCAILKDYGEDADKTIAKPEGYDPSVFDCTCLELCSDTAVDVVDCDRMLEYGKLPNGKYMINWPIKGNDYYINLIEMSYDEREKNLQAAKNFTLQWVYFIQTEGGYKNLGLADDEFPTDDNMPLIPYHRESRRLDGLVHLRTFDLVNPYTTPSGDLYKTGIAVGDYPLDHHHKRNPEPVNEIFPEILSYNVPYGCLIPKEVDGLFVAEKSISVTHLVNGTTRLQPVVLQIGQAAGAAAALCIENNKQPREISVRKLQQRLLEADCWQMPFVDIAPEHWAFQAVQRIGLTGAMKGVGIPIGWSNKTFFYPDAIITYRDFMEAVSIANNYKALPRDFDEAMVNNQITRIEAIQFLWETIGAPQPEGKKLEYADISEDNAQYKSVQYFTEKEWTMPWISSDSLKPDKGINRMEVAYLLDKTLQPFDKIDIPVVPEKRTIAE